MSVRTTPPPLPRKPHKWLRTIIVACALTPLLVVLVTFLSYRISNASAVRRLEAKVQQSGEPLTLAELAGTYPPIPDEDNGAILLLQLWEKEDPIFWNAFLDGARSLPARRETGLDEALPFLGTQSKHISRSTELAPANLAAAEAYLEEREEHLENVRQALRKPRFRFPINVTDGFNTLLPHLPQMRKEAQGFRIEALLATERGEVDGAITSLENVTRTGNALVTEPMLISQLVRSACYNMALESAERLLSRSSLSTAQLNRLATLLGSLEMRGALRLSLVSERAMDLSVFELPPDALAQAVSSSDGESEEYSAAGYRVGMGFLSFAGMKDTDRRLMLETMEEAISLADRGDAEALKQCEELFVEAGKQAKRMPPKIFCAMLLSAMEKAAIKFTSFEARRRSAIIAIAVERFRVAHDGRMPGRLGDLVPQFLPRLPADPFDGESFRYKKLQTGFVVYSVGPNRIDDGGKERPQKGPKIDFDETFFVER